MTRTIDSNGRFCIPKKILKQVGIQEDDEVEILAQANTIIIRKFTPGCTFCGERKHLQYFHGKPICISCIVGISGD